MSSEVIEWAATAAMTAPGRPGPSGRPPVQHTPPADAALLERTVFEVKRVIVGQDRLVERMLVGLLAKGHLLIEGVPGVAKTLAVETFARVVGGTFSRIQFTPDLVPSDLLGTRIYRVGREQFDIELGPVVANFVLTDEINRAPAKVQSALLEVMAERHVSIGGKTFPMPDPFLVMATQNPIENEGVYPLPEAQRDRFLFKLLVGYPEPDEEREIVYRMGVVPPVAESGAADRRTRPAAAGRGQRLRAPRAGRLRGPAGVRHPHPGRARADRGRRLAVLRRVAARLARHHRRGPRAGAGPRAATSSSRRTSSTSPPTCCGTGWCCPTTRWPTASRSRRSSAGCCRPSRCRRSARTPTRVSPDGQPRRAGIGRTGSPPQPGGAAAAPPTRPGWTPP